ncbi:MAG: porin family protein [Xanthomarina sp.]
MKKTLFISITCLLFTIFSQAQNESGFGIKGGFNYNANGNYFQSVNSSAESPERNAGFHVGVFGKFGDTWFIKPELVYTNTKSGYNSGDFKMQKLDVPVLVGRKFLKILNVFIGPSFQYILDTKFANTKAEDVRNDLSVGLNFGLGVSIHKVGVDLRYERGFSENEANFLITPGADTRVDTRPDQLILSVSFKL